MQRNATYVLGFAAAVCVVCAVVVSTAAVVLKDLQEANLSAYREQNVLEAAGFSEPGMRLAGCGARSCAGVTTGREGHRPRDRRRRPRRSTRRPSISARRVRIRTNSRRVEPNLARIMRVPNNVLVYQVRDDGRPPRNGGPADRGQRDCGRRLYGFVAFNADLSTIVGHDLLRARSETPVSAARSTTRAGRRCGPAARRLIRTAGWCSRWSRGGPGSRRTSRRMRSMGFPGRR